MTTDYLNFDLAIEPEDDRYLAAVRASPAGEANETFQLPFTAEGLENVILKLGHGRATVRRIGSSQAALSRRFGTSLYEAVFAGEVEFGFRRSIEEAERRGMGLRLRLNLDRAPELAGVPWELMYSPALSRPLVLSTKTPIARYIGLPFPPRPLAVEGPLRVLVVIAAPTDLAELDSEGELARIQDATADLQDAGFVRVDWITRATLGALVRRLQEVECHVLHFVGHGGYEDGGATEDGVLAFEDGERRSHLVSGDDLGVLLHDHDTLRLAVLNACEGARTSPTDPFAGVAQSLLRQGVPAVIAMQFEVTDEVAALFGHELYRALVDGCPVDEATGVARRAVFAADNDVEWATPVLYLRSANGHIFDVPDVDTTALIPPVRVDPRPDPPLPTDPHPDPPVPVDLHPDPPVPVAPPESPAPMDPHPDPHGPSRRRPWVTALAVAIGVVVAAALWLPNDVPPVVTDTDFEAAYIDAAATGGDWTAGLARYDTPHPAEGEADPRVRSEWALGWNEDALYLHVEVDDPEVVAPHADEPWRIYLGDGINVDFGADPDGMGTDEVLRGGDIQVMVGPANADADRAVSGVQQPNGDGPTCLQGPFFGRGREEPDIVASAERTAEGYRITAAVPWSVLGHQPEAGDVYGVILTVADADGRDGADAGRRGSRSTSPDRAAAKHCPGQWQTVGLLAP